MKTLLSSLMVVVIAFILSACGDPEDFESPEQDDQLNQQDQQGGESGY